MVKKIFILLPLFLTNANLAIASNAPTSCEPARQAAMKDCDEANIKEPLRLIQQIEAAAASSGAGTVPVTELSIANGSEAQRQLTTFEAKCYSSFTNCQKVCKQEAQAQASAMNEAAAQQAQQSAQQCSEEPVQNHAAAQAANGNLAQILPALASLLGMLKGDGGSSGDACAKDPTKCNVDSASKSDGAALTNNTSPNTTGSLLDAGLNTNDVVAQGESPEASMAQFGSAGGGGGGLGGMGGGSGGASRARGIPEVNADGSAAKANLNPYGGSGGGRGGGMQMSGASSASKGSGNPIASRVGIDGDTRAGMAAGTAAERALQARGLAGEDGQAGGITAAHAFDNFQKVEKRIQSERNKLGEL